MRPCKGLQYPIFPGLSSQRVCSERINRAGVSLSPTTSNQTHTYTFLFPSKALMRLILPFVALACLVFTCDAAPARNASVLMTIVSRPTDPIWIVKSEVHEIRDTGSRTSSVGLTLRALTLSYSMRSEPCSHALCDVCL